MCRRILEQGRCPQHNGGCGRLPFPTERMNPVTIYAQYCQCSPMSMRDIEEVRHNTFLVTQIKNQEIAQPKTYIQTQGVNDDENCCFIKQIKARVARKQNAVILIYGDIGGGKSYSGMRILEQVDPTFDLDRVIYTKKDLIKWTTPGMLRPGQALMIDEGGTIANSRRSLSSFNQFISELIQTCRQDRSIICIIMPRKSYVEKTVRDLMHYTIKANHINNHGAYITVKEVVHKDGMGGEDITYYKKIKNERGKTVSGFYLRKPKRIDLKGYEARKLKGRQELHRQWSKILLAVDRKERTERERGEVS